MGSGLGYALALRPGGKESMIAHHENTSSDFQTNREFAFLKNSRRKSCRSSSTSAPTWGITVAAASSHA